MTDKTAMVRFCPCCFADEDSGSWQHVVVSGHCTNCGNGSTVELPRWAVDSIREQASWVGKRYYPHVEDREAAAERAALLALVTSFPGRTAKESDDPGRWNVTQQRADGRSVMTMVNAGSSDEAMRKCGLRYVPATIAASTSGEGHG